VISDLTLKTEQMVIPITTSKLPGFSDKIPPERNKEHRA